jgi:hypothetical protein
MGSHTKVQAESGENQEIYGKFTDKDALFSNPSHSKAASTCPAYLLPSDRWSVQQTLRGLWVQAHDEKQECNIGDIVRIQSCRCEEISRHLTNFKLPLAFEHQFGPVLLMPVRPRFRFDFFCRPLSKRKAFTVTEIMQRARIYEGGTQPPPGQAVLASQARGFATAARGFAASAL